MTSPTNHASEQLKRQWQAQAVLDAPVIIGQSAEQSLTTPPEWQARQAYEDREQAQYLREWRRTHPQQTHRKATRREWVIVLFIVGLAAGWYWGLPAVMRFLYPYW